MEASTVTELPKHINAENFVNEEDRRILIDYLRANVSKTSTNVNPAWNGRVVHYENIPVDHPVKALLRSIYERAIEQLKNYFEVKEPIYAEAVHLVIWPEGTSLGDHADNAYANGQPNYVSWRSHSAVVYLNDDYEGGDFYFASAREHSIAPRAGTMLGFLAGMSHVHGVHRVTKGIRYTLPMWFTQNALKAYRD